MPRQVAYDVARLNSTESRSPISASSSSSWSSVVVTIPSTEDFIESSSATPSQEITTTNNINNMNSELPSDSLIEVALEPPLRTSTDAHTTNTWESVTLEEVPLASSSSTIIEEADSQPEHLVKETLDDEDEIPIDNTTADAAIIAEEEYEEYACHPEQEITREAVIDLMMEKLQKSREAVIQSITSWRKKDFTLYLQIENYIDQQRLIMKTSTRGLFSSLADFISSFDEIDQVFGLKMNPNSKIFLRDLARYNDDKYCRRLSIIRLHAMNEGELFNLESAPISLRNQLTAMCVQLGLDCASQIVRKIVTIFQQKISRSSTNNHSVKRLKK